MDVSSIPPTTAWENLQQQIQSRVQNQTETQYQMLCLWHFVFLPRRCWCCPSSPSLPHDAPGRRVGAPASLLPAWRGLPVMPTWSHCWVSRWTERQRVVQTELSASDTAACQARLFYTVLYVACGTSLCKLRFWEDKILCLNNPFPFFIAYLIIPSSIILLP